VVLFALLVAPWPFVGRAYGRSVAAIARMAAAVAGSGATIRIGAGGGQESASDPWHLRIHAEDPSTGEYVGTVLDLRRAGYLASAVFAALVLATPLRARRRLGLLLGGLALLQALPLLPLLSFFSGKLPVRVFDFGSTTRAMIELGYHILVAPPGMAYAVPGLAWLLGVCVLDAGVLRLPRLGVATTAPVRTRRASSDQHESAKNRRSR
jgi:hypothetical protein